MGYFRYYISKFFNRMPKSFGYATIACHNIKHILWRAFAARVALNSRPGLKLDSNFPSIQFFANGFSVPHRLDRNSKGGGVLLYVRDKIIVLPLNRYSLPPHIEILFFELNLRNRKWLVCCSYNSHKNLIKDYLQVLTEGIQLY